MSFLLDEMKTDKKQWLNDILAVLDETPISEIQMRKFKLDIKGDPRLIEEICADILKSLFISPSESTKKNLILILGSKHLGTENILEELSLHEPYKGGYALIKKYSEIQTIFFNTKFLLTSEYLVGKGNDHIFKIIYKFNYALDYFYQTLKPQILHSLINKSISLIVTVERGILENLNEAILIAKAKNYHIEVLDLQVNESHISNSIRDQQIRLGVELSADVIKAQQKIKCVSPELIDNYIEINSVDYNNSTRKDVYYTLNAQGNNNASIINTINNLPVERLVDNNKFSIPYLSRKSIMNLASTLSPHAVPIFDTDLFYPINYDRKEIASLNSDTILPMLKFRPERLFLHLLITSIYVNIKDARKHAQILIKDIYQQCQDKIKGIINKIAQFYEDTQQVLYPELTKNELFKYPMNSDYFTNTYTFNNIFRALRSDFLSLLDPLLKEGHYEKLSLVETTHASATFIIGGCGCGKTTYKKHISNSIKNEDVLFLNVDDLFDILYEESFSKEIIFSEWSFQETLMLHNRIINEIIRMCHEGKAPNLYYEGIYLLDSLTHAYQGGHIAVTYLFASLDVALDRVFKREGGISNPLGTHFVFSTYTRNVAILQKLLKENSVGKYRDFELILANTEFEYKLNEKPIKVCRFVLNKPSLEIFHFDLLCHYLAMEEVNLFATEKSEIYSNLDFSKVASFLKDLFDHYLIHFVDPHNLNLYLEINDNKVNVIDNFYFENNLNTWTIGILEYALNANFRLRSPMSSSSWMAALLTLIKNLQRWLYANKLLSQNDKDIIQFLIKKLRVFFENHVCNETNFIFLTEVIDKITDKTIKENLAEEVKKFTNTCFEIFLMKKAILDSQISYGKVVADSDESRFFTIDTLPGRFYESEFSRQVLTHPPKAMMQVIGNLSLKIIRSLEDNIDHVDPVIIAYFLNRLQNSHAAFGTFANHPTLKEVCEMLKENNPNDICQIILIHFVFSDVCYRNFEKFENETVADDDLFTKLWNPDNKTYLTKEHIRDFANVYLYGSPIFTDRNRNNRESPNPICKHDFYAENNAFSKNHGILNSGLLTIFGESSYSWRQDRFFSSPNLSKSKIAQDMFIAEIPYVSGASGMTTLFIPCALLLGKIKNQIDLVYYLLAFSAYFVHAGLHSWHEAFAVAEYKLNLLSSEGSHYNVSGKDIGNYNYVLNLLKDDLEIQHIRQRTWQKLCHFSSMSYTEYFMKQSLKKQIYCVLDHNDFMAKMTILDLDKLLIKLCELKLQNYESLKPISNFADYDAFHIKSIILSLAEKMRTSKSLEELDQMLKKFDRTFLIYKQNFVYGPTFIWQELTEMLQLKYAKYKEFEKENRFFWGSMPAHKGKSTYPQSVMFFSNNTVSLPVDQHSVSVFEP